MIFSEICHPPKLGVLIYMVNIKFKSVSVKVSVIDLSIAYLLLF